MNKKTHSTQPTHQYRYGPKPTWGVLLDAVRSFQRPVSTAELRAHISNNHVDFAMANVGADLSMLTVNSYSRGNYSRNKKPRRSDSESPYDRLIKHGRGRTSLYELYHPELHGVWERARRPGDSVLRPLFLGTFDRQELEHARDAADSDGLFDDERKRTIAAMVQREGQPAFRRKLLQAYDGRCAISGCAVEVLLEAAHIVPYGGARTNVVGNGLLLRTDLHKLLDLHLIAIDPTTRTVRLSHELQRSEYACFADRRLRDPEKPSQAPLTKALQNHYARCGWLNAGPSGEPLEATDENMDGMAISYGRQPS